MRIASTIARYLLGLMLTVFGLNGFLNFIHQPPPTNPLAIQFFVAISTSHFAAFFFAVQLIGGLLLLSGYFVPLALTLLAAEIYNILAFHLTFSPETIAPAWPIRRPVGAVRPAMKPTTGFFRPRLASSERN